MARLCEHGRAHRTEGGRCRLCKAATNRRHRYGITPEDFKDLWAAQGGKCALCFLPATDVDHDHATNKVRGLLCQGCNTSLGQFGDTAEGLERAVAYLRKSRP